MADTVQAYPTNRQVFRSKPKPIVAALALLIAGGLTFSLGITHIFFVEAMAWTFAIWGALLMFNHLVDFTTRYEVTDESFIIHTPLVFWRTRRTWHWTNISRMNVVVARTEARAEDATIQVYHSLPGTTVLDREDIVFDPELARLIAERAGLKAKRGQAMQSFDAIPQDAKETYNWQ
ncbi:MAG: hypothetical protein KF893_09325 [Caldilineaceae bacterium]|nr:hypothetical protein [Caldilineaceae bacterium]